MNKLKALTMSLWMTDYFFGITVMMLSLLTHNLFYFLTTFLVAVLVGTVVIYELKN